MSGRVLLVAGVDEVAVDGDLVGVGHSVVAGGHGRPRRLRTRRVDGRASGRAGGQGRLLRRGHGGRRRRRGRGRGRGSGTGRGRRAGGRGSPGSLPHRPRRHRCGPSGPGSRTGPARRGPPACASVSPLEPPYRLRTVRSPSAKAPPERPPPERWPEPIVTVPGSGCCGYRPSVTGRRRAEASEVRGGARGAPGRQSRGPVRPPRSPVQAGWRGSSARTRASTRSAGPVSAS